MRTVLTDRTASEAEIESKNGLPLQVDVGSQITIDGVTVSVADIAATNGVIHVIDTVLIPQR